MKTLQFFYGQIEVTLKVEGEDYQWVHELFLRNARPFKALRDLGYNPIEMYESFTIEN